MLNIRTIGQLADALGVPAARLRAVARDADKYYDELTLLDPVRPDKPREIVSAIGPLRGIQARMLTDLLRPQVRPSRYSHGGVASRSIKTNAEPHLGSTFVFSTDIQDFFPSIQRSRVFDLFCRRFRCSNPVSQTCARLCTRMGRLTQGAITSPIVADSLMADADKRIGRMCEAMSWDAGSPVVYTRFVDDLVISAQFPLDSGTTIELVVEILAENGFQINRGKHAVGRLDGDGRITKLRVHRGRLYVSQEYLDRVNQQLTDATALARGEIGKSAAYQTQPQIYGRLQFIRWINPGQFRPLMNRFAAIDWRRAEALSQGLLAMKKRLVRKHTRSDP